MRKMLAVTCVRCSKSFEVQPSRLNHGRGKHCSPACQYADRRDAPKKMVDLACIACQKTFQRNPSYIAKHARTGSGRYCSRSCRDVHRRGVDHPGFRGGEPDDRGTNWQSQRRAAKERDDHTCQHCGVDGIELDVHHKIPFRLFGMARFTEANSLDNLITLCRRCHRIADAAFQSQET